MIPARGPQTKLKEIPGLSHHGDERTCPQVLRAKHLLTMGVFQQSRRREILQFRLLAAGLGRSRQVWASLGKTAPGNPDLQAIGGWARQVYASLGKSRQVGGDGKS